MKAIIFIFLLLIPFCLVAQDGQLDPTFTPPTDLDYNVEVIAQQADGKILIGGFFDDFQYLKRLNTDGSLDTSFSSPSTSFASMKSIAIQPDGKILAGGFGPKCIVRLNTDGSIDNSFDIGSGSPLGALRKIILLENGKIIIGGAFQDFNGTTIEGMARLNADGSLDTTFNLNLTSPAFIRDFDVQANGKVIIAGYDPNSFYFKRYNTDNTEDTNFNAGNSGPSEEIYGINVDADDKIMITGPFETYNNAICYQMARLNIDGILDTSFQSYNLPENGFSYTIFDAKKLPNGQYLINGYFDSYNDFPSKYIAKINNDGTIDETFDMGSGADEYINSTYMQEDGNILIGGDFISFNGTNINHMARLNSESLGIEDMEDLSFVTIYPNPFNDVITLQLGNMPSDNVSINIFNTSGKLVKTDTISENKTINCSGLQSGVYLVKINNGTAIFNTKIIKQ